MRRLIPAILGGIALGAASLVTNAAPASAATSCTGLIQNQVVSGNLSVPAGEACALKNVLVTGSVVVNQSATLSVDSVDIDGNLTAYTARTFNLKNLELSGSLAANGSSPAQPPVAFTLCGVEIGGNASFNGLGATIKADCGPMYVAGGGTFNGNKGAVTLGNATFGTSLSCWNNTQQPTGNVTAPQKLGQCAGL